MFINKRKANRKTKSFKKILIFILILLIICSISYFGYSYINYQTQIEKNKQELIEIDKKAKAIAKAIEAKKNEPVYINLPNSKQIRAIVDDYSQNNSIWALVSKTSPLAIDYIPTPISIPDILTNTDKGEEERSVRSDIVTPLETMFDDAETYGYQLMVGSGYRSADLQSVYFYSLANSIGEEAANQSIARPGQSEHQTGLAVDISTVSRNCYLSTCFADTDDGKWLENNSYKYGFILRYPEGKELITGYNYEPWHFRYVGVDLATAIYESGLTLDEAWPYLQAADETLKNNGAISSL